MLNTLVMPPLSKTPDTAFSKILWDIVKHPELPKEVLPNSRITETAHRILVSKWSAIIKRKTTQGAKNGLSLSDFERLINEFYGDRVLNTSSIHRLIYTGNPSVAQFAKKINEGWLARISHFTTKYSYQELLKIGNDVLATTLENKKAIYTQEITHCTNSFDSVLNNYNKEFFHINAVRSLFIEFILDHGYQPLQAINIFGEDILEFITRESPRVHWDFMIKLQNILKFNIQQLVLSNDISPRISEWLDSLQGIRKLLYEQVKSENLPNILEKGLDPYDLLEMILSQHPKVDLGVMIQLPTFLGISQEEFLKILYSLETTQG